MSKIISKKDMYQMNTIATKLLEINSIVQNSALSNICQTKKIKRTRYLKICWNCGCTYESGKYNSYACNNRCSWNINYKLKRGIIPPTNMALKTKIKNIKPLLLEFGY